MVQIKILLENSETWEEVREDLKKALGTEHDIHEHIDNEHRPFQDLVLQDVHVKLNKEFAEMYNDMFREIETVLANPHLQDHY